MKLLARTTIALGAALLSGLACADSISGLVNTGSGLSSGQTDSHYSYKVTGGEATGLVGNGVVSYGNQEPFPYWMANDATSSWLIPSANQSDSYDNGSEGTFSWSLNFDLTGFDASTASFSGRWAADNNGVLLLNGNVISSISGDGYASWTTFAATTGFLAGSNTLTFVVTNTVNERANYTGLRAEFLSSNVTPLTVAPAVPEPQTYAMMLAGLGVVGFVARRRRGKN